jgi:hypothetical protein
LLLSSEYGKYQTVKARLGLSFQVKVLDAIQVVPFSLGGGKWGFSLSVARARILPAEGERIVFSMFDRWREGCTLRCQTIWNTPS